VTGNAGPATPCPVGRGLLGPRDQKLAALLPTAGARFVRRRSVLGPRDQKLAALLPTAGARFVRRRSVLGPRDQKLAALMFFNSTDLDLLNARPGTFAIAPTPGMVDALKRDYQAMLGIIFGEMPEFSDVLNAVEKLEQEINQRRD